MLGVPIWYTACFSQGCALNRGTKEGKDCYNRLEGFNWMLSGQLMDWNVAIYNKNYVLYVFHVWKKSEQECDF